MNWQRPSSGFAKLLMELGSRSQERTIDELFDALEIPDGEPFLIKLAKVTDVLNQCEIEARPKLQDGAQGDVHLLQKRELLLPSESEVLNSISNLESATQELKTTYWCDYNRLQHQEDATCAQLRSNPVKHSALKAIAGFLTTGGGTLYIGVADNGEIVGLDPDLSLLDERHRTIDGLINIIKTDISDKFYEGNSVNDYVEIYSIDVDGKTILVVVVSSRHTMSFLRQSGPEYYPYRRQENRTTKIEYCNFEEFLEWRKQKILGQLKN